MLTAPTPAKIESIVHGRIRAVLAERAVEVGTLSGPTSSAQRSA
jgi:hypothetical protein